jgi:hypothetical protein
MEVCVRYKVENGLEQMDWLSRNHFLLWYNCINLLKNVGPSENISAFSPGVILNRFVHERILKENVECNTPFLNEFNV